MKPTETQKPEARLRANLNALFIGKQTKRIIDGELSRIELLDAVVPNLRLRLGLRSQIWTLLARTPQRVMIRVKLGNYLNMNVSEARIAAKRMHIQLLDGFNPTAAKKEAATKIEAEKREAAKAVSLRGLFDIYAQLAPGGKKRSWPEQRKRLERLFAAKLNDPMPSLQLSDFQRILDFKSAETWVTAFNAYSYLKAIIKWASAPGRAYCDPSLKDIHLQKRKIERDRVLDDDELTTLLATLNADRNSYNDCAAFILLTCLRRGEAERLEWSKVDFTKRIAMIPLTKNGEPFEVQLSNQAIALLRSRTNGHKLVFTTRSGTLLRNWSKWSERIQAQTYLANFTLHDLRRTGATVMGNLGIEPHVIEYALNHIKPLGPIAKVYNKATYKPQIAIALQKLADHYERLCNGGEYDRNVIQLPVAR